MASARAGFYEVQHLSTPLGLVGAGLGVAALRRMSLPSGPHPVIAAKRLVEPVVTRQVGVVSRSRTTLSPSASRFYEILMARWRG